MFLFFNPGMYIISICKFSHRSLSANTDDKLLINVGCDLRIFFFEDFYLTYFNSNT